MHGEQQKGEIISINFHVAHHVALALTASTVHQAHTRVLGKAEKGLDKCKTSNAVKHLRDCHNISTKRGKATKDNKDDFERKVSDDD